MIEVNSLADFLVQCAALLALGVLLALLVHFLRFRHGPVAIPKPRVSALWALLAIGAGWLLVVALFYAFMGDAPIDSDKPPEVAPAGSGDFVGQLLLALVVVAPILFIMHRRGESPASAGVSAYNLGRSLVVSVVLASVFVLWCFLVSRRCDATTLSRATSVWALLQFTVVGFAEEFAYRGYLQTRLIRWLGHYQGWVLASVLMAMAHVGHRVLVLRMTGGEALVSSASLVPISLFLGYVMLRTRSIVAPGLLHTAINWLEL